MGKIRGTHSSPGVYTQFTDLSYAAKSLGITTLGLVGETKKGPAFEPIPIANWGEFTSYFGGTSPETFKGGSEYPKYELPYIAKSYLSASDQLYVCRVLGLSGYNAGPAWLITASGDDDSKYIVAVLRSRGSYYKFWNGANNCDDKEKKYDTLMFDCDKLEIKPYTDIHNEYDCTGKKKETDPDAPETIDVTANNLGRFTLIAYKATSKAENEIGYTKIGEYPVSFNAGSKDYIYNVLGSDPTNGTAAVFVEEFYDVMLQKLAEEGKVSIIDMNKGVNDAPEANGVVTKISETRIEAVMNPVADFISIPSANLTRKYLGQRYLCDGSTAGDETYQAYDKDAEENKYKNLEVGHIYVVKAITETDGSKTYVYVDTDIAVGKVESDEMAGYNTVKAVKVISGNSFFHLNDDDEHPNVVAATNMSDYHEEFRCASTPWIVSEIKGDSKNLEVKKLFRFHTISDGTNSNSLVKISIANIKPDEGRFDVLVRDFNDSDTNPVILESFKGLTMMPGDSKYIGLKIGTLDGAYESMSKFVMVEIIDNEMTRNCVPCGFLGYPVRDYAAIANDNNLIAPTFAYNTTYSDEKPKRHYFGLSDLRGVDVDMLYYKGKNAYTDEYTHGYTNPFHLDSTLNQDVLGEGSMVTIDGDITTSGLTWETVSPVYSGEYDGSPIIGTEEDMEGTLFENVNLRKFTVYPYGGFDGWDIYRKSRTNTDEFKANKYKGSIVNGEGLTFSKIQDYEAFGLDKDAITSDYYAYLAGVNQFERPEQFVINLFATPGIDYVNNNALVNDVLDMIEEKRGDTLYVVTTPDKPFGASDARHEMYSSADAAENLDDAGIDTYYAATYYPWVKYFDKDNSIYVNLPATKDALRNMANVDNKKFPWYAPAGIERGNVECIKMHFFAKLEDEDNVYNGRINPLKTFSEDGVKIWGNKTMYSGDTPMNRVNVVRLMLYMRKLIAQAALKLIFDQNDATLRSDFEGIIKPILSQIKTDRGITDYRLTTSQTPEQMDAHEISAVLYVKPTPTLEYIEINFVVTPQGVQFDEI